MNPSISSPNTLEHPLCNLILPQFPISFFQALTSELDAQGLLNNKIKKAKMDWSRRNLIAIQICSRIYFYKDENTIQHSIDLNQENQEFTSNYLNILKFSPNGHRLLTTDFQGNLTLYDSGTHFMFTICLISTLKSSIFGPQSIYYIPVFLNIHIKVYLIKIIQII